MVAEGPVDHLFTGRAHERPLEIVSDVVPGPKGDGASPGGGFGRSELRDERVVRVNQACQVTDERLEILFAAAVRGCLDDRTERREFFGLSARHVGSVRGRMLLGRFSGSFVCLGHRYLPDDEGPDESEYCRRRSSQRTASAHVPPQAFYSSSAGNRNRRARRCGRLTATPRGGPTNCRELPRNPVAPVAAAIGGRLILPGRRRSKNP